MKPTGFFKGKTALVTGAAGGLGSALTTGLLRRGATVLATDLVTDRLEKQWAEDPEYDHRLKIERLDVRAPDDFKRCVGQLIEEHETLDIIINNAGLCVAGQVLDLPDAHWRNALQINFEGTLNGCRAAAEVMKTQGSGHIVNIASISGLVPFPVTAPYNASKAAIVALSRTLRMELVRYNISVTVVCPGQIDTNMFRNLPTVNLSKTLLEQNNPFRPVATGKAADKILRALAAGRFMVVFPRHARWIWWMHRVWPGAIEYVFRKKMAQLRASGNL